MLSDQEYQNIPDDSDVSDVPESWHVLDFVPFHPDHPSFLEFESYLEQNEFAKTFASRISFIAMALVAQYDAEVWFDNPELYLKKKGLGLFGKDPGEPSYARFAEVAHDIVEKQRSGVTVAFPTQGAQMDIGDGFEVALYGAEGDFLEVVRLLAEQNGLFLKFYENRGENIYLYDKAGEKKLIGSLGAAE